jgi:DNA-binding NtrC family response regulator
MTTKILVADDEAILRISVSDHLRNQGWQVDEAETGVQALELIKKNRYDLLLSDIRMPELDGEALLEKVKEVAPHIEVVMMTAHGSTDTAVNCLKNGAADYIQKPFDLDDLCFRINRILDMQAIKARCVSLEQNCTQRRPLIGSSAQMQKVLNLISQVAGTDSSVLIQGESGTGKELVAAAIHYESRRAQKPYIRINCAAIPAGLMESEFFGHEKGAFTGADKISIGKFELADQGTILLDEIGDMPLDLQVKLLRVLQEKEIERVGGKHTIPINVRVLCSTAKNLADEVEAGNFRQDLFYRLQVIPIELPPLRERNGDISELSDYFLQEFGKERGMTFEISEEARQTLEGYHFPSNVRELHNLLERVTVLAHAPKIQQWELPIELRGPSTQTSAGDEKLTSLAEAVADAEKRSIRLALKKTLGNKTEAASLLGISRKNLWEKMKLYNHQE